MKIIDDLISSLQGGKEKIKLTDEGTIDKKNLGVKIIDLNDNSFELSQPFLL